MDTIEIGIVSELSEDARKPFRDIAKKLGVSPQTIKTKYEEMKKNGTIKHCSIMIDLQKIGYRGSAHLLFKIAGDNTKTIERLRSTPNIITVTRIFSEYQVYAVLVFKDIEELYKTLLELKSLPEVSTIDFGLAVPGMQYFPPNDNIFNRMKTKNNSIEKETEET
jgi:Lrp/AsnC family transcriptional regulator, regulator for asnA, asnC and gidA